MKKMLVFIAILVMIISMFSVNALMIKKTTWGFNALTGQIGFPTAFPKFPTIKPVCSDTDASPDYALIGIPAPEVQQNNADLFVRGQATGVFQSTTLPQITGENPNKCSQRFLDPSATYSTFMDCCSDSKTLTEAFCKGSTGPFSIQIPCKYGCKDGVCLSTPQEVCTDTDNGKAYDVKGVTTAFDGYQQTDVCHSPTPTKSCSGPDCYLSEYYCTEGLMVGEENLVCPAGCQDGACVGCSETDGGRDYYAKGTVIYASLDKNTDVCLDESFNTVAAGTRLVEYFGCDGKEIITCPCQDGACVKATAPYCTDSDNGQVFDVKGFVSTNWPGWNASVPVPDKCAVLANAGNYVHNASCSGNNCYLIELWCSGATPMSEIKQCSNCVDGACVSASVCTDSDGGLNMNTFGWTDFKAGSFESRHPDACALVSSYDSNGVPQAWRGPDPGQEKNWSCSGADCYVEEAFCRIDEKGNFIDADADQLIKCTYGCKDGACLMPVVPKPPELSCQVLQENVSTAQYFTLCSKEGYDNVCFNKYAGVYQGCTKTNNNDCTVNNMNADQNVLCPVGIAVIPQPPVEQVSERVTCMFRGSRAAQKCYSLKGACSGKMFCVVAVTGARGEKVSWKSSCGGEATTVMDGRSDSAVFTCRR